MKSCPLIQALVKCTIYFALRYLSLAKSMVAENTHESALMVAENTH